MIFLAKSLVVYLCYVIQKNRLGVVFSNKKDALIAKLEKVTSASYYMLSNCHINKNFSKRATKSFSIAVLVRAR